MLISGAGGQGFTSALLQGRQLGNQARALREQAHQRRQQLALGIGGLGVGAIGALGGLAGTVGNLVNMGKRTGIMEEELGLQKAARAPVPGALFGHPEMGDINPTLAALLVDKERAGRSDVENKITLPINMGKADEVTIAANAGLISPAEQADLTKQTLSAGLGAQEPQLMRAIAEVKRLEGRPEYGADAFTLEKMKGYNTDAMAEHYARLKADPTIQPEVKKMVAQEWQRRQQLLGKDVVPSFEEMQQYNPLTPGVSAPSGEPGADIFADRFQEAMNKARERKRLALEWAMAQDQGIGPRMP